MASSASPSWVVALERIVEPARPAATIATRLAVAGALGGATVWWAVARALEDDGSALVLAIVGVLLAIPPLALALLALAARAVLSVPRKLREAPDALRAQAERIRERAGDLAATRERGAVASIRALARLWWAVASSREVLEIVGPAALLLTPATLVAGVAGAAGAVLEVIAGLVAAAWLALT